MKKIILSLSVIITMFSACIDDILLQPSSVDLPSVYYWKSTDDALTATMGVYAAMRTVFNYDDHFDGMSEFVWVLSSSSDGLGYGSFNPAAAAGSSMDTRWSRNYQIINRANYVQSNIQRMIANEQSATLRTALRRLEGENRFIRALAYFDLIKLWGDVPFYTRVLEGNDDAVTLTRAPIDVVKDSIVADLTFAIDALPPNVASNGERGRATQPAAYALRGKVQLYWASWKKYGWPELKGFTQDAEEAKISFGKAAEDLRKVIYDYGLALYSDGNPGTYHQPSYWNLFQPDHEYEPEIIFAVQNAGPLLGMGEAMQRRYGMRNVVNSQSWVIPTYRLVNRYQSTITGDDLPPLVLNVDKTIVNGSRNLETYDNRDWRMKATIVWDGQKMLRIDNNGNQVFDSIMWLFGTNSPMEVYINPDQASHTGYAFRKWIRQTGGRGARNDGPMNFYLIRLADVYLMYCEAVNEVTGPDAESVGLINKIRRRGNLPPLAPSKYADATVFFNAIEQERIVELIAEGHRGFDIRRWRKVQDIWKTPEGQVLYNVNGARLRDEFVNAPERDYQRFYLFRIPPGEIERNRNLIQNEPWL
jgi:hypothetical protein